MAADVMLGQLAHVLRRAGQVHADARGHEHLAHARLLRACFINSISGP